jgi:hypothetical protein
LTYQLHPQALMRTMAGMDAATRAAMMEGMAR